MMKIKNLMECDIQKYESYIDIFVGMVAEVRCGSVHRYLQRLALAMKIDLNCPSRAVDMLTRKGR